MRNWIKNASVVGLHLPFVFDAATGKPSVTLMFMYFTFLVALSSVIALHFFPQILQATITSIIFWAISVVFYRMRRIDDLAVNLRTGSVEVKDDDKPESPTQPMSPPHLDG